jgi:membrane protein implicated in regulation of membrane protease activity
VIVGLLASAGLAGPLPVQVLTFSVVSIALLLLFRARLLRWMQAMPQAPPNDTLVGEIAMATEPLPPGHVGRIELRGTVWSARNASPALINPGDRCRVVRVDGLLLDVTAEGARA